MKRVTAAGAIFLLLILGCAGAYWSVDQVTKSLAAEVQAAHDALGAEDCGRASEIMCASYQNWRGHHELLGTLVRHNEIDEIENLYLRAIQCAENGDRNEGRMQTRELAGMLRHLTEMEQPRIGNIL